MVQFFCMLSNIFSHEPSLPTLKKVLSIVKLRQNFLISSKKAEFSEFLQGELQGIEADNQNNNESILHYGTKEIETRIAS